MLLDLTYTIFTEIIDFLRNAPETKEAPHFIWKHPQDIFHHLDNEINENLVLLNPDQQRNYINRLQKQISERNRSFQDESEKLQYYYDKYDFTEVDLLTGKPLINDIVQGAWLEEIPGNLVIKYEQSPNDQINLSKLLQKHFAYKCFKWLDTQISSKFLDILNLNVIPFYYNINDKEGIKDLMSYLFSTFNEFVFGRHRPHFYFSEIYDDSQKHIPSNINTYFDGLIFEWDKTVLDSFNDNFRHDDEIDNFHNNEFSIPLEKHSGTESKLLKFLLISVHITKHRILLLQQVYNNAQYEQIIKAIPEHVLELLENIETYEYYLPADPNPTQKSLQFTKSISLILQYGRIMLSDISLFACEQYTPRYLNSHKSPLIKLKNHFSTTYKKTINTLLHGRIRYLNMFSSPSDLDLLVLYRYREVFSFDYNSLAQNQPPEKHVKNSFEYLLFIVFLSLEENRVRILNNKTDIEHLNEECINKLIHLVTNRAFISAYEKVPQIEKSNFINDEIQFIKSLKKRPIDSSLLFEFENRYSINLDLDRDVYVYFERFKVGNIPLLTWSALTPIITGGALFSYYMFLLESNEYKTAPQTPNIQKRKPVNKNIKKPPIIYNYKEIDKNPEKFKDFRSALIRKELISEKTTLPQLRHAFTNKIPNPLIEWIGTPTELKHLLRLLIDVHEIVDASSALKYKNYSKVFTIKDNSDYPFKRFRGLDSPADPSKIEACVAHLL